MKSETLHKLPTLSTILLLLCGCVWSLPCKCDTHANKQIHISNIWHMLYSREVLMSQCKDSEYVDEIYIDIYCVYQQLKNSALIRTFNIIVDQQPARVQTQQPQEVIPHQSEGIKPQPPVGIHLQQPLGTQPQRPILLIQNNLSPDQASNYKITIPKAPQSNEPCLTISWKTNPDGSGPDAPRIYFVNGYFQIMSPPAASTQH